jgi:hypothetical protein
MRSRSFWRTRWQSGWATIVPAFPECPHRRTPRIWASRPLLVPLMCRVRLIGPAAPVAAAVKSGFRRLRRRAVAAAVGAVAVGAASNGAAAVGTAAVGMAAAGVAVVGMPVVGVAVVGVVGNLWINCQPPEPKRVFRRSPGILRWLRWSRSLECQNTFPPADHNSRDIQCVALDPAR